MKISFRFKNRYYIKGLQVFDGLLKETEHDRFFRDFYVSLNGTPV